MAEAAPADASASASGGTGLRALTANELATQLRAAPARVVVLDLRPYSDYAVRRIDNAFSVRLSSLLIRRLLRGKMGLADLLVEEQRAAFAAAVERAGAPTQLVLYDQDTRADDLAASPTAEPTRAILLAAAKEDCVGLFLDGGFELFERDFPDLVSVPEIEPRESPFLSLRSLTLGESPEPGVVTPGPLSLQERHIHLMPPTEVLPFLFIGKRQDATERQLLDSLGITGIISLAHQPLNDDDIVSNFDYLCIPVRDSWDQNLPEFFDKAFAFIDKHRSKTGKVMVHCTAGISRSPALVIAYIMKTFQYNLTQAYEFVKGKRALIAPNLDFMSDLQAFETKLLQQLGRRDSSKLITDALTSPPHQSSSSSPTSQTISCNLVSAM